jgi:NADPH-dependent F420 reductase
MRRIAILGGTGPEGMGLGLRFAQCGDAVVLGSRQAERAVEAAARATEQLRAVGVEARVSGAENRAAVVDADLVVLTFPFAGVAELLPPLADALAGKIVLDVINPMVRINKVFSVERVPEGSAAELIQQLLPASFVVSAFKNESAEELNALAHRLHGDVVVCSDHTEARARIIDLVRGIPHYRAVDAGALVNARALEHLTALLLNINKRHRAVTSIQILGLQDGGERPA